MNDFLKRTWAEVSLNALDHNYDVIRAAVNPKTKICCVVKADAYGHGASYVSREFQKKGADWFAVSNLEEAIQLRRTGILRPILILGYTPPQMAERLQELSISQSVFSTEYAKELSDCAIAAGVRVRIHVKLDSGMSRIGFLYQNPERDSESLAEIEAVCKEPGLIPEGIFTHFSVADDGHPGEDFTMQQYACFDGAVKELQRRGITFEIRHCSNSGAVVDYPQLDLDMVRPGVILYGLLPSDQMQRSLDLQPAMELKTVISQLKTVEPGTSVSYGREFVTERKTVLATVPIGYADGYPRRLHDKADMLVCGKRARVVGRVCMDQVILDVTDIPGVHTGMTVTIWGRDGDDEVSVDEIAKLDGTIHYEMICLVGKRVPRVFLRSGKPVGQLNYICPEEEG